MKSEANIQMRVHGNGVSPALIYLPGIHGDWTLISSFRLRMQGRVRFVEFTYPRTLSWSLADYGRAVREALAEHGVHEGVLLGESFGSQVAWEVIRQSSDERISSRPESATQPGERDGALPFATSALILAGGFGRYPFMSLVDSARVVWPRLPGWLVRGFFRVYGHFARWRHRHAPETRAAIREFLARRTPLDLAAMGHRLKLIRHNDPVEVARSVKVPVLQLTGLWDPVVFAPAVNGWLRRHCPEFRGCRVVGLADHNVLATAPVNSATIIDEWLADTVDRQPVTAQSTPLAPRRSGRDIAKHQV